MATHLQHPGLGQARQITRAIRGLYSPGLPRCDSPKWGAPGITQIGGGFTPQLCPCSARDAPLAACPYVTRDHVAVHRLSASQYEIEITDEMRAWGTVTIGAGPPTRIDDAAPEAVTLTGPQIAALAKEPDDTQGLG